MASLREGLGVDLPAAGSTGLDIRVSEAFLDLLNRNNNFFIKTVGGRRVVFVPCASKAKKRTVQIFKSRHNTALLSIYRGSIGAIMMVASCDMLNGRLLFPYVCFDLHEPSAARNKYT